MDRNLQQELQKVVVEAENYKRQIDASSNQLKLLEGIFLELEETLKAIESIKKAKTGGEMLVPIGSDSYIKAELIDNKNVILGIGAKVSCEETIGDAKKTLEDRKEKVAAELKKMHDLVENMNARQAELNHRYEHLVREIQQAGATEKTK